MATILSDSLEQNKSVTNPDKTGCSPSATCPNLFGISGVSLCTSLHPCYAISRYFPATSGGEYRANVASVQGACQKRPISKGATLGAVKLVALGQGLFALVEVGGPHAMLEQHGMRVGLDAVSLLRHFGRYARLVTNEDG